MKTLVAGFGNILLGDDGFGVEVVRRLAKRAPAPGVEIIEVGIGGFDFVLRLMDRFDRAIVVDAVRRNAPPGTLHVMTASNASLISREERIDPHIAEPSRAMRLAQALKVLPDEITLVGCEPLDLDVRMGLSAPVEASVDRAIETIRAIVAEGAS